MTTGRDLVKERLQRIKRFVSKHEIPSTIRTHTISWLIGGRTFLDHIGPTLQRLCDALSEYAAGSALGFDVPQMTSTLGGFVSALASPRYSSVEELISHIKARKQLYLRDTLALGQLVVQDVMKHLLSNKKPPNFDIQFCRHYLGQVLKAYSSLIPPGVVNLHSDVFESVVNLFKSAVVRMYAKPVKRSELSRWGVHLTEHDLRKIGKRLVD